MEQSQALQLALGAAEFIERQRVEDSVLWRRTDEPDAPIDLSVYHGAAGVSVFFLELAAAGASPTFTERAIEAGRVVADRVMAKERSSVSFATGWPGYSFALLAMSEAASQEADRRLFTAAASHCLDRLWDQSTRFEHGVGWIEPMPFSDITGHSGEREIFDLSVGAAGAGLALLDAYQRGLRTVDIERVVNVADRLLDVGEATPDGTRWGLMADMPFAFSAPNFAHGSAGVGYFFARLFEQTGEPRFLAAAQSAAHYTMSRASAVGDGCLVCHTEEAKPPSFYLGSCHGPAGTDRLMVLLGRLTDDPIWAAHSASMLNGLRALGAPQTRSWGWWNNYGQCCGDAGLGDYALSMWELTRNDAYLQLAHDCAEVIAQTAVSMGSVNGSADAVCWPMAEHRARPQFVQSQTGYMQGAAGIGSFLVHLATIDSDQAARIRFPDELLTGVELPLAE